MFSIDNNTLKTVGVRYAINEGLGHRDEAETDEMVERTISKLEWIKTNRPLCVLVADKGNCDPCAVKVLVMGTKVGYIDRSQAAAVRTMLKSAPRGMLVSQVEKVCVGGHGYFYLRMPEQMPASVSDEVKVDWDRFQSPGLDVLAEDYYEGYEGLSMVIGEILLPRLSETRVDELRTYIDQWMDFVRYNQSMEVEREMCRFVKLLSSDPRAEVRQMAEEIDHLRTRKGAREMLEEMTGTWWEELLSSEEVRNGLETALGRTMNRRRELMTLHTKTDDELQALPGSLYDVVDDSYEFFRRLNYMTPPLSALRRVLSLLAVRTLVRRELRATEPEVLRESLGVGDTFYNNVLNEKSDVELVYKLVPIFYGNRKKVGEYVSRMRTLTNNAEKIEYTAQLVKARDISDKSCHRTLWEVLYRYGLYPCKEGTWNKCLSKQLTLLIEQPSRES